ncbi:MAG TPA: LysM peptidoglycan-binding domain-containing protein [Thermoanaerobaculia bacterium]|nr:LysM peptidoglycan-binding domain-containing protein [Thermoanaerobaculia bacterium]
MDEKKSDQPAEPMPDFSDVVSGASSTAPVIEVFETYEVKRGDNLSKIAKHVYGHASHWKRIFEANTDQLHDPDKIYPGQKLKLPKGEPAPKVEPAGGPRRQP